MIEVLSASTDGGKEDQVPISASNDGHKLDKVPPKETAYFAALKSSVSAAQRGE